MLKLRLHKLVSQPNMLRACAQCYQVIPNLIRKVPRSADVEVFVKVPNSLLQVSLIDMPKGMLAHINW